MLLGLPLEPLEYEICVKGHGVSRTFTKKSASFADRVEAEILKLDHRSFTPDLGGKPGAGNLSVAANSLTHETAQTNNQRLRDWRVLVAAITVCGGGKESFDQREALQPEIQVYVPVAVHHVSEQPRRLLRPARTYSEQVWV